MTDWEGSDRGNDDKVKGMAVEVRGFGIEEVWEL